MIDLHAAGVTAPALIIFRLGEFISDLSPAPAFRGAEESLISNLITLRFYAAVRLVRPPLRYLYPNYLLSAAAEIARKKRPKVDVTAASRFSLSCISPSRTPAYPPKWLTILMPRVDVATAIYSTGDTRFRLQPVVD